jgi:MFS family permease
VGGERGRLTRWLAGAPPWVLVIFAISMSFSTYFCMYAFRKPFSAAQFEGLSLFGTQVELKTAFVISQVIGYALSKYLGIKFCSEMTRGRRLSMLIGLVVVAEIALLLFAVLPSQLKIFALFVNGLPLGMVWGLVVWYLEGRRTSELLLAGLSCSFILASGVVKDIGRWLMGEHGVSEFWMPFATGLIFLLPFVISTLLLDQLPDPDDDDESERTHRVPMDGAHRISFLKRFLVPLAMLFFAYVFLTAYRDFRDNYGVEIFTELGYGEKPGIFSMSEICVAFGVLVPLALLFLIRDNFIGLLAAFSLMLFGALSLGVSTLLLDRGTISGLSWMILVGIGSYLAYIPYGSILFDRMIAQTQVIGTAVFAIYVADALGYTGSVAVLLFKDLVADEATRLDFLRSFTYLLSAGSAGLILVSAVLILRGGRTRNRSA